MSLYLLGPVKDSLIRVKLPSVGDVMRLYMDELKSSAKTKQEAAYIT